MLHRKESKVFLIIVIVWFYVELVLDVHLRCTEYITQTLPSILSPYSCWWCLKNLSDLSAGHFFLLLCPFLFSFVTLNIVHHVQFLYFILPYALILWLRYELCSVIDFLFYFFFCQASVNEIHSGFNYSVHWLLCHHLCVRSWKWLISVNIWNEACFALPLFFF